MLVSHSTINSNVIAWVAGYFFILIWYFSQVVTPKLKSKTKIEIENQKRILKIEIENLILKTYFRNQNGI